MTIIEPIGRAWEDELVYVELPGQGGARAVDRASGKVLPSQVMAEYRRDGLPEPPRLCVRVSLRPDERVELDIEPSDEPPQPGPFSIRQVDDGCEIASDRLAVRIPGDGSFNPGAAPGPILAMRRAEDRSWTGRGTWGPVGFTGRIETRLLDRGPLVARWITRYIVGGVELARYDVRLIAGEDFVQISDETALGAGINFSFRLDGDDSPTHWCTHGGGEAWNVTHRPVSERPNPLGRSRPGEFLHIDFSSGHFQMSYTWVGLHREGGPLVGLCELNGGRWQHPGRNRIRVVQHERAMELRFPVDGGSKRFALVCGEVASYAPPKGLSRFCHLRRKYSDLPLEKVRHWVTQWELPRRPRPMLYPPGTAERWQAKLDAWPELRQAYQRLAALPPDPRRSSSGILCAAMITGDATLRDSLFQTIDKQFDLAMDRALNNGYLALIIFHGRIMKVALEAVDLLRWTGQLDARREQKLARRFAFLAYCFADADFWPWDSVFRPRLDPRSHGEDYWDDIGDAICPPNFSTEYYTTFGVMGVAYPEHPESRRWIDKSVELFERNLATQFYEGGGYIESVNYHDHELSMMLQLATALLAAGQRDFFAHPRFKANFGFFVDMLTPSVHLTEAARKLLNGPNMLRPPGDGRARFITNWGNSGQDCSGTAVPSHLPVAAGIYADRDPLYARRLMTAWRQSPQKIFAEYSGFNLIALGRPDLPDVDLDLDSRLVEGLGATMRVAQGKAEEIFAWIKCGLATHHNCRDEGGIVLYARGAPLIGDFGYTATHAGKTEGATDTWKHACVTFGGKSSSGYLGTEITNPPELWRSTPIADLLIAYTPVDYIIGPEDHYLNVARLKQRIEHRRFMVFVKPHYFVIYDHIPQTPLASTWWLHALADATEISGAQVRFRGRWNVDLHAHLLLPAPARITSDEYSVQRHVRVDQAGPGDYLAVLTPLARGESAPSASFDADNSSLHVRGPWGTDQIQLLPQRRRVTLRRDGKTTELAGD